MTESTLPAPAQARPTPMAIQAASSVRSGSRLTSWLLWLLCDEQGYRHFCDVYDYFRWADDIVDDPERARADATMFITDQLAMLQGERAPRTALERGVTQALAAPQRGERLRSVALRMARALEFDAARSSSPIRRFDLESQLRRIGEAYADALWICTGAHASAPPEARLLGVAATRVHVLRDLSLDLSIGYCNVPIETLEALRITPSELPDQRFVIQEAIQAEADFAEGLANLTGPWRTRLLMTIYALRYRGVLRSLLTL